MQKIKSYAVYGGNQWKLPFVLKLLIYINVAVFCIQRNA